MTLRRSVECWLTHADGEILLLHVPPSASLPQGFWQPLTGGVEAAEKPLQAAVRDVREKTGQQVDPAAFRFMDDGVRVQVSADFEVVKSLYVVELPSREIATAPAAHDDHRWMATGEVGALLHWQSNRETWQRISALL
ncbi:NUDIX domain-containing protein [Kribbella sp. CA-293567]|uniref:NUDIX domain-containing protein n=1 Tax=Kribbella sp. CA-293567 TaxID=3002436 RepID=UPI0022DD0E8B|nr:NUDIX domain-containing protein [Kribbella sp. CA-293567]WBQ03208.1 NUDIX domain-containing protein [Kribbella sp. CA-293567]